MNLDNISVSVDIIANVWLHGNINKDTIKKLKGQNLQS